MEVHHHAHTSRKKLIHYFWEFLMLFLAVFCGFLAENYREHKIENERAHQYALQLLNDLQIDSAQLQNNMALNTMFWQKMDTLRKLIDRPKQKDFATGQLYYYGRFTTWYNRFVPNDATIQQMKSSGSIRYFQNFSIEQKISEYDRATRKLILHETSEYTSINDMWQLNSQLFRGSILDSINQIDKPWNYYVEYMRNNYPLVTNDPPLLQKLSNLCRARQLWISYKIDESYRPSLKSVIELIGLLKKEYHLNE